MAENRSHPGAPRRQLEPCPGRAADLNIGSNIEATLKSAGDALQAGRPYLSLEKLAQAFDLSYGARAFAEKSGSVKTLAEFDTEWRKTEATLALPAANWSRAPAALPI